MPRKILGVLVASALAAIVGCDLTSRSSSAATATKDSTGAARADAGDADAGDTSQVGEVTGRPASSDSPADGAVRTAQPLHTEPVS